MGEGQWRVDDGQLATLNELDDQVVAALERGDETDLKRLLQELTQAVRDHGERLDDDDLAPSDVLVPPSDLSLEEARELFSGSGLIPDLPV
jgi:hypothetical protein